MEISCASFGMADITHNRERAVTLPALHVPMYMHIWHVSNDDLCSGLWIKPRIFGQTILSPLLAHPPQSDNVISISPK